MTEKKLTGYPSIDKPWLKYYDEKAINSPLPKCSMYEYLYQCNKDYLDNTALNYFGKKITYKKLFENIDKVAVCLQAAGVKKGDIISVCTLTAPESVYLLYAINKVGAVSNWLGLTSPVQDLHEQLASTDSKLVFAVEMAYDLIVEAAKETKVEKIVSIPIEYSMPTALKAAASLKQKHPKLNGMSIKWKEFLTLGEKNTFEPVEIDCETMALIMYTGGTTGTPKGVMISNNAANSFSAHYVDSGDVFYIKREHSFLNVLPPFLAFGAFACTHMPLCNGVEVILSPDPNPQNMPKLIIQYRPNHFCCGPLHINSIMDNKQLQNMDLSFVYSMIYGGESTTIEWQKQVNSFLKTHGARYGVINGYGMTEAAGAICTVTHKIDKLITYAKNIIKIINPESKEECAYNETGEIVICTPTMMLGYYHNLRDTNEIIYEQNGIKWLRTGDLGKISENGELTITGRIKRIYWRKCDEAVVRVYPMRIEETLEKSKYVKGCCVVGKKDDAIGYSSIAYIILKDKTTNSETVKAELDKLCRENLPESHVPDEYRFVESFPLTRAGKVDFRALEKMAEEK